MKNYIIDIVKDEYLRYCILDCEARIQELNYLKDKANLITEDINKVKILISNKGKWVVENFILFQELREKNNTYYHEKQLSNLTNDYIKIKALEDNCIFEDYKGNKEYCPHGLIEYFSDDKTASEHMINKINKHLKCILEDEFGYNKKATDVASVIKTNRIYGFKIAKYIKQDSELQELYYVANILSHNNTRISKIIDKEKKTEFAKYIYEILQKVFYKLNMNFNILYRKINEYQMLT